MAIKGETPNGREGHSALVLSFGEKSYIFYYGGFNGTENNDECLILDLGASSWEKCEQRGDLPG